ncbi:MAG TPA: hypothetical protein PLG10_04075 [Candidatus Dojkabacteria bacterium]|nr:hypothetical protein [Candidatus Dojkabacteria bacterium]
MKVTEKQVKKVKKKKKKLPIYYKVGRPTKYKKKYCKELIKYFDVKPTHKEKVVKIIKGVPIEVEVEKANPIPTFDSFATEHCGVNQDTFYEWVKVHPEFSESFKRAKSFQKKMILYQCSYGFITPSYAVFLTKALTDLNDISKVDVTTAGEKIDNVNLSSVLSELKEKSVDELQRET